MTIRPSDRPTASLPSGQQKAGAVGGVRNAGLRTVIRKAAVGERGRDVAPRAGNMPPLPRARRTLKPEQLGVRPPDRGRAYPSQSDRARCDQPESVRQPSNEPISRKRHEKYVSSLWPSTPVRHRTNSSGFPRQSSAPRPREERLNTATAVAPAPAAAARAPDVRCDPCMVRSDAGFDWNTYLFMTTAS